MSGRFLDYRKHKIYHSYHIVTHLWREVYYVWCVHYMNSNGVSSVFSVYDDWMIGYVINWWVSGEVLLLSIFYLLHLAALVDEWWILCTNILSILHWRNSSHIIFICSILCSGIVIIHLYYLHYISNSIPLGRLGYNNF